MFRTSAVCRTVFVKDLVTEQREGANGTFEAKSILFRVASDRNYTRPVQKDGKTVNERPTDFVLCRANGALAQIISDHCSAVDGAGKLVSRHLYLVGHFETYTTKKIFKVENMPVVINGATYNLNFDDERNVDGLIFIVDELEFLDKKPTPTVSGANGVTVSGVSITPVAQEAGVAIQAQPIMQAQPQVVTQAQPVATATVAQSVVSQPVQNTPDLTMAQPVVPEGFTGENPPF